MTRLACCCVVLAALTAGCGSVSTSTSKSGEPTIASLMPDHGPTDGGIMVTLTGANLSGNPLVLVGGHAATMVSASSDSSLTFMLPAGDQEGAMVDVTVANDHGFATKPAGFRYTFRPVILTITPAVGKATGGTMVTITGRGFTADDAGLPTITLAGGAATNIQVASDTMITATTGPAGTGIKAFFPQDATLTNLNGTATASDAFEVSNQGLILLEGGCCQQNKQILFVDPTNGSFAKLVQTQRRIHGCALGPNGKLFAVGGRRSATFKCDLTTFDPLTGAVTSIGLMNDTGAANHCPTSLAFIGNTLYGLDTECCTATNRLLTIDTNTGAVTVVGATPMSVQRGTSITAKDGSNLWYVRTGTSTLDTIAVATSTLTPGTAITGGTGNQLHGMTNIGASFFVAERNPPSNVYTINTATAALTKVTTVPFEISGMCQTPPSF